MQSREGIIWPRQLQEASQALAPSSPSLEQDWPATLPEEDWQPIAPSSSGASRAPAGVANRRGGAAGGAACLDTALPVAAFLAGPVRSLLVLSVHRTMRTLFYDAFGGRRVLFARLYDAQLLDASHRRRLRCVLHELSGGEGEWSAPRAAGRAFVSNASHVSRCRFAAGTQLREYPYMAQSLERQLATLRACFERLRLYEATRGLTFAYVLRTRTDTAFLRPALPFCRVDAKAVLLARARQKGDSGHHMFADHAAIVPRSHAEAFFMGVRRLAGKSPACLKELESTLYRTSDCRPLARGVKRGTCLLIHPPPNGQFIYYLLLLLLLPLAVLLGGTASPEGRCRCRGEKSGVAFTRQHVPME